MTKTARDIFKLVTATILTVAAMCELVASSPQQGRRDAGITPETRALVSQATASIGLILVRNSFDPPGQPARPRGSAVVVRRDGIVVTNCHVITNDRTGKLYDEIVFSLSRDDAISSLTRYRVKPVLLNREYDLALLRVESDAAGNVIKSSFVFPAIEIADVRKIKLLDELFIIGFPQKGGSTVTVNRGVVEGKDILGNWIKTDARVIHGNSGGAAVNSDGKLVGIPTKVVADEQPIDKDGDGFPDDYRRYGAVGFLRPAHLIGEMLAQLTRAGAERQITASTPAIVEASKLLTVRGVVKATDGKPIAGALIGLLAIGEPNVTERTLLTWGSTNGEGEFVLNKPVPPGRYLLRAKALARQPYTSDVEIAAGSPAIIVRMSPLSDR
ncbi:MAG TPA: trypsin-like peptidase domain-containing protein [Blastocatellia bacterium]|nr:trypsin-like peptidase domain-containing protein [Blastocatellia bacterium]